MSTCWCATGLDLELFSLGPDVCKISDIGLRIQAIIAGDSMAPIQTTHECEPTDLGGRPVGNGIAVIFHAVEKLPVHC